MNAAEVTVLGGDGALHALAIEIYQLYDPERLHARLTDLTAGTVTAYCMHAPPQCHLVRHANIPLSQNCFDQYEAHVAFTSADGFRWW